MNDKILGYDWDLIQRVQRKQATFNTPAVMQPLPAATDEDRAALRQYGSIEALQVAGMHGIVDRLSREPS